MSFIYRKRLRAGRNSWLNLSRSGVSASRRVGRVTVNSRGGVWVPLLKGLFYRGRL